MKTNYRNEILKLYTKNINKTLKKNINVFDDVVDKKIMLVSNFMDQKKRIHSFEHFDKLTFDMYLFEYLNDFSDIIDYVSKKTNVKVIQYPIVTYKNKVWATEIFASNNFSELKEKISDENCEYLIMTIEYSKQLVTNNNYKIFVRMIEINNQQK